MIMAIILKTITFNLNNAFKIPTGIPKIMAEIIESKMDYT
jgi:hypothetical protein